MPGIKAGDACRKACMGLLAAAIVPLGGVAMAQDYPSRPIKLVIPFAPGGPNDVTARVLADELTKSLQQNVVVENKPGAGGNIAAEQAARATADGYTLFWAQSATHGVNPWLYKNIKFDPMRDFASVALVGQSPIVLVGSPKAPVKSARDVIAMAKQQPGKLTFGSGGNGTTPHMAGELLNSSAKIKLTHVPYKGSSAALVDAVAGRVDVVFDGIQSTLAYVKSGQLIPLAVGTKERVVAWPDVPTLNELVPGYEVVSWNGVSVPAGTPPAVINRLNEEINRALKSQALLERFAQFGITPTGGTPAQMAVHVRNELEKWKRVVAETGASVD